MVRHATHLQNCANSDSIDKINKIFVGEWQYSSTPSDALKELDGFCEEFLSCTCCEDHEVATKLARLSLFLCFRRGTLSRLSDDDRRRHQEDFSVRCGNNNPPLMIPATPIDFAFLKRQIDQSALEERHQAGIPWLNCEFGSQRRSDRIKIPYGNLLQGAYGVPWWRADCCKSGYSLQFEARLEFDSDFLLEFRWIEPANVNRYLWLILEEKVILTSEILKQLWRTPVDESLS